MCFYGGLAGGDTPYNVTVNFYFLFFSSFTIFVETPFYCTKFKVAISNNLYDEFKKK